MKLFLLISLFGLAVVPEIDGQLVCDIPEVQMSSTWLSMRSSCIQKMKNQVNMALYGSMSYFAMGSFFLRDVSHRPGFGKFFLDSAREERQHAINLMEYLLMRGELASRSDYHSLQFSPKPHTVNWNSGVSAFKEALKLKIEISQSIQDTITTCESDKSDVHTL